LVVWVGWFALVGLGCWKLRMKKKKKLTRDFVKLCREKEKKYGICHGFFQLGHAMDFSTWTCHGFFQLGHAFHVPYSSCLYLTCFV
jgi:hypothetical protein